MADRGYSALTKLGIGALAFNSALAIYNSWGDVGSVGFVIAADVALWLLFMRRAAAAATAAAAPANRRIAVVTTILFLTATCAVAIHRAAAAGDVATLAFVVVSYGALLLLHRTHGAYETERERLRRRVWELRR